MTDGRNIDSNLGTLSGEGSGQGHPSGDRLLALQVQGTSEPGTYYGRPVIKKSVWSWSIPLYYYVGGTAGGAAVLGGAATLLGRRRYAGLIVRSRWIGTVGAVVSGALLVHDLGKPSRFLNMLRVFRPTSPMNLGSWVLTGFSSAVGLAAVAPFEALADGAGIAAGALGLVLSGYTGVLVSQTVVPVWQRPHRTLPLLFLASAMSGGASMLNFFPANRAERRTIAIFGAIGQLADLASGQVAEQQIATVPEAVRPLQEGFSGFLWKAGKALTAASLVLALAPGSSRTKRGWIGALGTAGALCLRFGIHHAGQRSAENPLATFHQQRAGTRSSVI